MNKRCPFCKESIREEAVFCRHCNRDLDDMDLLRSRQRVQRTALILFLVFGAGVILTLLASLR